MNISTLLRDESLYDEKPAGGYQWWYFDAISLDEQWALVIIFYHGNPFSTKYIREKLGKNPGYYPAISVSVYNKLNAEYYSFLEFEHSKFIWDEENFNCSIGGNSFQRNVKTWDVEYDLLINQALPSGHSLFGKLKFIGLNSEQMFVGRKKDRQEKHLWNLIHPHAKVVGSLKLKGKSDSYHIGFSGNGYHDHNLGFEPMKDSFEDWYWGRVHFEKETLVYYMMNQKKGFQQEAWLFDRATSKMKENLSLESMSRTKKNRLGLKSEREINLIGDRSKVRVVQNKLIDNGPFYQRFISKFILTRDGKESVKTGITEYINPSRIYLEKYWWMVHMRLRYMNEEPHWVQKKKMFYEWTW
ncbi:MAG: hypothetical protein MI700_12255 [Balneolales bacterium]|nr:hypothetical protein [Balneolales bacterium]